MCWQKKDKCFLIPEETVSIVTVTLVLTFEPGFPVGPLAPRPPRGPYMDSGHTN